ncbi:hypothetical protein K2X96_00300 [Patescibacteria group bacterium]|nr:hypothetical protein [Patescibacteria group bacterium]
MAQNQGLTYLAEEASLEIDMLIAVVAWVVSFCFFVFVGSLLAPVNWGVPFAVSAWIVCVGSTLPWFMVSVPEYCGLITINVLGKPTDDDPYANMEVYETGLSFCAPYKQRKLGNYINLRAVAVEEEEDFAAKNGPAIKTKQVYMYRADPKLLPRYIAADDSIIREGLVAIGSGYLSEAISHRDAQDARGALDELNRGLRNRFETFNAIAANSQEARSIASRGLPLTYESLYGIDFIEAVVADADYEAQYQTALSNSARSALIDATAAKLAAAGIAPKDAANAALLQYGVVSKTIFEVEGNAHQALAAVLASLGKR